MKRIGLLSDTHGFVDEQILNHFKSCDEIWHAGDIGTIEVSDKLSKLKPLSAVFGNVDGRELRIIHPEILEFECEGLKVLMIHIGGYPGNYSQDARKKIESFQPGLFICGHSHILKVMPDKKYDLLHMNPGAAGKHGFHKFRTMLRFEIADGGISNVEVIELGLRGAIN